MGVYYYKSTPRFPLSILNPLRTGSNSVIDAISKINQQKGLKQAGTHMLRCEFRPLGGSESKRLFERKPSRGPDRLQ
jgi:hypothetical protein